MRWLGPLEVFQRQPSSFQPQLKPVKQRAGGGAPPPWPGAPLRSAHLWVQVLECPSPLVCSHLCSQELRGPGGIWGDWANSLSHPSLWGTCPQDGFLGACALPHGPQIPVLGPEAPNCSLALPVSETLALGHTLGLPFMPSPSRKPSLTPREAAAQPVPLLVTWSQGLCPAWSSLWRAPCCPKQGLLQEGGSGVSRQGLPVRPVWGAGTTSAPHSPVNVYGPGGLGFGVPRSPMSNLPLLPPSGGPGRHAPELAASPERAGWAASRAQVWPPLPKQGGI